MRKTVGAIVVMLLVASVCGAQGLDGKKITLTVGDQPILQTPVSIAFKGEAPATTIVVEDESGAKFPATARNGELVFIPESLEAGKTYTFKVSVLKTTEAPKVEIKKKDGADELDVTVNGEAFTTYHYSNDNRKPFLWPVYAEGNVGITRNWPMGEDDPKSVDHIHHKGIWSSYGDVNGVDCWAEDTDNAGYQHSGEVTFGSGDAYGWIHAKNVWQDKDHKPVISEEREYRFFATAAAARTFDEAITFTASEGPVKFGDTKEGGIIAYRVNPKIEVKRKNGQITMEGYDKYPECWGKPSPWCDYTGELPGAGMRGIAVFDNPTNFRYPTRWHARDYGLNGANVFATGAFTEEEQKAKGEPKLDGSYTLEQGKSMTFQYRVIIHSGNCDEAKVAVRCAAYTKPPKAEWAK